MKRSETIKRLNYLKKFCVVAISTLTINSVSVSQTHAHARWVVPSHTVTSGDKPIAISLDYSISNDIFHPDIALGGKALSGTPSDNGDSKSPMATIMNDTKASMVKPNGDMQILTGVDLGRKTSTYFTADTAGTYRVEITQPPIDVTLYKNKEGESQRLFGNYNAIKNKLPEGANAIESIQFINRIQTFITHNEITLKNLEPSGKGLELKHTTHPNELFANEKSKFQLLFDGKPIKSSDNSHIKITKAGTRFRNQRNSLQPEIQKNGTFEVIWPSAGFYLIEVDHEVDLKDDKTSAQAPGKIIHALFLTLEIHPE